MISRTAPRNGGNPIVEYVFLAIVRPPLSYRPLSQQTSAPVQARWADSGGPPRPPLGRQRSRCPSIPESWPSVACRPAANVPSPVPQSRAITLRIRRLGRPRAQPKSASNHSSVLLFPGGHSVAAPEQPPATPALPHSVSLRWLDNRNSQTSASPHIRFPVRCAGSGADGRNFPEIR